MLNREPVIVTEDWQIKQRLRALGMTPEMVRTIALAAAAAKADAMPVDPCSSPGTLSYIHGVRATRLQLLPLGWKISREGNVESTVNHEIGVQICFQNVDRACGDRDPEAISGKGSAARDLVYAGQMEMFPRTSGQAIPVPAGTTPTVWLICVSTDNEAIRAEVSCPRNFEGDQFEGFLERIFVVDEPFAPQPGTGKKDDDGDSPLEFDVSVTKK